MQNILFFYNNDEFLYLMDELKKMYKINNYYILKTGERANKTKYKNNNIYSDIEQLKNLNIKIAFVISESPFVNKMHFELYKLGINKVYTINSEYLPMLDQNKLLAELISEFDFDKPLIGYLETHLYNKCNLNCKGCTHFSNIDDSEFMTLEEYENNISLLSKLYNINTFRLMGGEPLLNEKLGDYLKITRKYFPKSNIDIATNGLLLCNLNKDLIEIINDNNIIIKISLYLPIEKIKDKIEKFLTDNKILHFYGNGCKQVDDKLLIRDFHKCLTTTKKYDSKYNSENCFARECWFLKGSFIAKCATPLQINILNEKFNTNFKLESDDFIDISKLKDSSWIDIERLLNPIEFCRYCSPKEEKYRWEINNTNQQLSDYVIVKEEE